MPGSAAVKPRSCQCYWLGRFTDHVIDSVLDFLVGQVDSSTLRQHRRGCIARETIDCMVIQDVNALSDAVSPLGSITHDRCTTNACAVTGEAGRVVYLRARQGRGNGLWFCSGFDNRCGCVSFVAGQVDLANRRNSRSDSGLILGGVARVNTLCQIGHLHGQHEDRQSDRGQDTDYEGVHVKKFLIPTQLTAPELELKGFSRTIRPAEAGDYITRVCRSQSSKCAEPHTHTQCEDCRILTV